MSRLESMIRRLTAQRDILDRACRDIAGLPGPVIELGLGNGRTFDHLRERLPDRRIIAFDRVLAAYGSSIPPADDLVLGEIGETAAGFAGIGAALVHADIGTGYDEQDAMTLSWLPRVVESLLTPGAIAVSGLPLAHALLIPMALPAGVPADRYFVFRHA